MHRDDDIHALQQVVLAPAQRRLGHVDLVEGVAVHEDVVRALLVEVGHVTLVDLRHVDLRARVEGLVDDLAADDVLQGRADEGAALARLDVLELHDAPQPVVEREHHAVLEVVRGSHARQTSRTGARGSPRDTPRRRAR